MPKSVLFAWLLFGAITLSACSSPGSQPERLTTPAPHHNASREKDDELARRFAPIFYFHPAEIFRPQSVDVILKQARLRQSRRLWLDTNVLIHPDVLDLFHLETDESYFLDVWYGDDGSSESSNYSAHQADYEARLSPQAGGPPVVVYAHVVRHENPGYITIQYWALYFYNDWFNKHEGDWEMAEVILTAEGQPEWVVLSQHHGGTRRAWASAPVEAGTHPVVYVALGSHANYFVGNETYPNGEDVGNAHIEIIDRTGTAGRLIPDVIPIPDRAGLEANPEAWPGAEWLHYRGHWGEMDVQGDVSGPLGPADKGIQWEQPYVWGMDHALDTEVWYANRLRVEVVGAAPGEAVVQLKDERGSDLPAAEELGNPAILHTDVPTVVAASIKVSPRTHWDVVTTVPNVTTGRVTRMRFNDVQFTESGNAALEIAPDGTATLIVTETRDASNDLGLPPAVPGALQLTPVTGASGRGGDQRLMPSETETFAATWDAPDLVWMSSLLPVDQLGLGIAIALLASLGPTMVFVAILYWVDLYEKEPLSMLAAAFMWGAVPALAVALVTELFFRLPPNLIGPQALEAVRLGVVAPMLEEALKGAAVFFIYWRYRREFDDVLDGMIYGAIVGFGFAMTANLLSYIGSFMLWGYGGLSAATIVTRTVHALDHGLYTAVLGAGLGFARLAQKRWHRWLIPVGAFGLAIAIHTLHNLLAHSLVGLNILTVTVTGAGTFLLWAVAGWSLRQRRRCLRTELKGMLPEALYGAVVDPLASIGAQWRTLGREGVGAWRRTRRLHHLCAELGFKRMQARLLPDEPESATEAEALWAEIRVLTKQA